MHEEETEKAKQQAKNIQFINGINRILRNNICSDKRTWGRLVKITMYVKIH